MPVVGMTSVLIVDDSTDARIVTAILLASEGFDVTEAADGFEAIASVVASPPDSMLLDYNMPGLNGVEVAARIKAQPQGRGVRIVLYTAVSSLDVICTACASVIRKPAPFEEVVAALRGH